MKKLSQLLSLGVVLFLSKAGYAASMDFSSIEDDIKAVKAKVGEDIETRFGANLDVFKVDVMDFVGDKSVAKSRLVSNEMSGINQRILKHEGRELVIKYKEGLSPDDLAKFLLSPQNRSVESLTFENAFPAGFLAEALTRVASTLQPIEEHIQFTQLKSVIVSVRDFRDEDLKTLADLLGQCIQDDSTVIESIMLKGCCQITDAGLASLGRLTSLKTLDLIYCDLITDAGLASLGRLVNLTTLNLTGCVSITDAGLASLGRLTSLKTLNLSYCDLITDAGLASLGRLVNLTTLNLIRCRLITGVGLASLAGLGSLTTLNLGGCSLITDAGLVCLGRLTNLTTLNLRWCDKITDAGLASLAELTNLTTLDLRWCNLITDEAKARLEAAIPGIVIIL